MNALASADRHGTTPVRRWTTGVRGQPSTRRSVEARQRVEVEAARWSPSSSGDDRRDAEPPPTQRVASQRAGRRGGRRAARSAASARPAPRPRSAIDRRQRDRPLGQQLDEGAAGGQRPAAARPAGRGRSPARPRPRRAPAAARHHGPAAPRGRRTPRRRRRRRPARAGRRPTSTLWCTSGAPVLSTTG